MKSSERSDQTNLEIQIRESAGLYGGAVFKLADTVVKRNGSEPFSQGENVLAFAVVALQFETDFSHAFGASSRLDFVCFFAFCGSLRTSFLVELFLSSLAFLLETFEDIDSATLWKISSIRDVSCV